MAKKNINATSRPVQPVAKKPQAEAIETPVKDPMIPAWLYDFKIQAIIVVVLAFAMYCNTIKNEYALDDTIVIVKNEYVYEGFAGLKSIMTKDAFDSYYKQFNSSNQLSGGRYRPLSIATFAIEQQFLGPVSPSKVDSVITHAGEHGPQEDKLLHDMHVRHFFNVIWFMLSMLALLYFLRFVVFKNNTLLALIATVLFVIHPIHTEVVANVKSRDEIMSLLFISLTFILAFKYQEQKDKKSLLVFGLVSYVLAFLSKEYAIALAFLLPLSFYIFKKYSLVDSIKAALPYLAVVAIYLFIRLQIVASMSPDSENDILNNPYALANDAEKLGTKIATCLSYLRLLVFPYPLSADYSYNSIPYKDFTNLLVWLSLAVHIVIIRYFFVFLKQRNVIAFAIAFYMTNLLLICNIIFNIGGTMGERLIYHSSVGFCIAVAYFLYKGMEKIQPAITGRRVLAGVMVLLIIVCGFRTIARNADWKNDQTLFFKDIESTPNSILVNADVASSYINMADAEKDSVKRVEDIHKGLSYFDKAIEIDPVFVQGFLNRSMAYFKLKRADSSMMNLDMVRKLYPRYPKLDEMYYNIGVNFYVEKQYQMAINAWQVTLQLNPNYALARNALVVIQREIQQAQQQQAQVKPAQVQQPK
jgi:tetratricopeptide (TPR) repeat protein